MTPVGVELTWLPGFDTTGAASALRRDRRLDLTGGVGQALAACVP